MRTIFNRNTIRIDRMTTIEILKVDLILQQIAKTNIANRTKISTIINNT